MIALLFLKDVDERVVAEGGRVTTPLDAWEVACWTFQTDEWKKLPPRRQSLVGLEFELPVLEAQSPETQWRYFALASSALAAGESRQRG